MNGRNIEDFTYTLIGDLMNLELELNKKIDEITDELTLAIRVGFIYQEKYLRDILEPLIEYRDELSQLLERNKKDFTTLTNNLGKQK